MKKDITVGYSFNENNIDDIYEVFGLTFGRMGKSLYYQITDEHGDLLPIEDLNLNIKISFNKD